MGLMMLGRQKYTYQNHWYLNQVRLTLSWIFKIYKSHKSPRIDEIPAEVIRAGGRRVRSEIHKFIISFWNERNCLMSGRSRSLYLSIRRPIKQAAVITQPHHFVNYVQKFIQHTAAKVSSIWRGNYWGSSMWFWA
jgi:hypothetical protein